MNINFAPIDEAFIKAKVGKGYYSNATELVRDAVRKLREKENSAAEQLLFELEKGERDYHEGRFNVFSPKLMEELKQSGIRRANSGLEIDPIVCPE